jgi:hypothetical protein
MIILAAAGMIFAQTGQPAAPAAKPAAPAQQAQPQQQANPVPAVPATPLAIKNVLSVRQFTLASGYQSDWRAERPIVTSGTIIVLEVDPAAVYPRQTAQPVLYVGNQTAERINVGYPSGKVVAIVPGDVDLATTPIWFGAPALPEQVDANTIKVERDKADKAGIKPIGKEKAATVTTATKLNVADKTTLLRDAVGRLVRQHAPDEAELAATLEDQAPEQGGGQPQR